MDNFVTATLQSPYFALVSLVTGSLVTWLFAWLYFKKAGDDLRREAAQLRKKTDLIIYCLTNPGVKVSAEYVAGEVVGLNVSIEPEPLNLSFTLTASPSCAPNSSFKPNPSGDSIASDESTLISASDTTQGGSA